MAKAKKQAKKTKFFTKEKRKGAAWRKENPKGHMISVVIGRKGEIQQKLYLLPNSFRAEQVKRGVNAPDYMVYVA